MPRDPDEGFCAPSEADQPPALRLWVSDAQWQAIIAQVDQQSELDAGKYDDASAVGRFWKRAEPRWAHHARCLIRLSEGKRSGGTFLARTRNVSTGGVGFINGQPIHAWTRCTVALQTAAGEGRIAAGCVAWCRQVSQSVTTRPAFEVGVEFDQPIDLEPVLGRD